MATREETERVLRDWWLIVWPGRMDVSTSEEGAALAAAVLGGKAKIIHVREVLDE